MAQKEVVFVVQLVPSHVQAKTTFFSAKMFKIFRDSAWKNYCIASKCNTAWAVTERLQQHVYFVEPKQCYSGRYQCNNYWLMNKDAFSLPLLLDIIL